MSNRRSDLSEASSTLSASSLSTVNLGHELRVLVLGLLFLLLFGGVPLGPGDGEDGDEGEPFERNELSR